MRIRLCLPFYESISEPTRQGVRECLTYPHFQWDIKCLQSSRIALARNHCLNDAKTEEEHQEGVPGVEYFLFVDSDIGFRLADVLALLTREVPIVSGCYVKQGDPESLCAGHWKGGIPGNAVEWLPARESAGKGLQEVGFFGAGFLLIHRPVLAKLPYPWFQEVTIRKDGIATILGEDQAFCRSAQLHEIPCLLDTDVRVRHLGRKVSRFNWDFQGDLKASGVA